MKPQVKAKVEELFLRFLTEPGHYEVLIKNLEQAKCGEPLNELLKTAFPPALSSRLVLNFYEEGAVSETQSSSYAQHISLTSPRPKTPPNFPHSPSVGRLISPRSPRKHSIQNGNSSYKPYNKNSYHVASVPQQSGADERGSPSPSNTTAGITLDSAVQDRYERGIPLTTSIQDAAAEAKSQTQKANLYEEHGDAHGLSSSPIWNNANFDKQKQKQARLNSMQIDIPRFYFPGGKCNLTPHEVDKAMVQIDANMNEAFPQGRIQKKHFAKLVKLLQLPLYWKSLLYSCCTADAANDDEPVSKELIKQKWRVCLLNCPDDASKFIWLMTGGSAKGITPTECMGLIQDVLETHPGLQFLQTAQEFHSRYILTVVARLFFCVNCTWSGVITALELRRSDFLKVLAHLEYEEDINMVPQYFSYEHFYVIYCKFWELDDDHDLIITKEELAKHGNHALSSRIVDRIFSGAVRRREDLEISPNTMNYSEFVWFILAEEDKRHPRSIEYWFRCMDLDGDGVLSLYELEYFYEEMAMRVEELGIDPISFQDCMCQMLDMVTPQNENMIRLRDLKRCRMTNIFFDTFFNLPKYLDHEQKDPFSNLKDIEEGLNNVSDWDRYAVETYEILTQDEANHGADEEFMYDSDFEPEDDLHGIVASGEDGGGLVGSSYVSHLIGGATNQSNSTVAALDLTHFQLKS